MVGTQRAGSARPRRRRREQRCFWRPNGILMFMSTENVRKGRWGGESEAESGELSAEDQRRWWFMSQLMTFALGRKKELKLI